LLAPAYYAVVLADARPAALLAPASSAGVLADARPAAFLAPASYAVVLADARLPDLIGNVPAGQFLLFERETGPNFAFRPWFLFRRFLILEYALLPI